MAPWGVGEEGGRSGYPLCTFFLRSCTYREDYSENRTLAATKALICDEISGAKARFLENEDILLRNCRNINRPDLIKTSQF